MENATNKSLYRKAKEIADATYKKPSAYKSMFISKKYMELGGKFKGKSLGRLSNWRSESWVQVVPYLETGNKVVCGEGSNTKGCRPTKRINKDTPITIDELIKIHGKKKLLELAKKKKKNMDLRINWKAGKVYK
tara:strand:+ start:5023 stop:5424 length:402 start_codon:yes stop_codon:yes gene_type:complete